MRGAGKVGPRPEATRRHARRSRAHGRRLGPRHRQVGTGRLDHPVGAVDDVGHARHRHRQHRGPAPHQDLARARQVARAFGQQGLVHLHRDLAALFRAARPRQDLAGRCHHLVGEQHRGHRRSAQQGQARLRPVRRGLVDRRRRVGDHRGRADRCRHGPVLAGLRQPDAHHRPLPRMLRRRPLRPSLEPAADRFALGVDDQQGADRDLAEGLRRGFRFRPRAGQGRLPARRHHAVHRQRARSSRR